MRNFYSHCIFCFNELTKAEEKGTGEHIVPEFLYGSVCVKDVCVGCNSDLGRIADHLAVEDSRIISAAFALNLPELQNKIRDRGTGKIIDVTDGSEGPVRFKNGKPWVVPQRVSDDLFVSGEQDVQAHLLRMLRKRPEHGLDPVEVEQIVKHQLMPRYDRLGPGESVSEQRLGVSLRKAPGEIHQEWKVTEGACEQLVAKIGYETAFLVFDRDRLAAMPMLRQLAAVAMGQGRLDRPVLMYPLSKYSPVNSPPQGPKYHHQIIVWLQDVHNIIDIYFFGCVGFRLLLRGDSPAAYGAFSHPDGDIDMVSFLMKFEPGEEKKKYLFLRRDRSGEVEEYSGRGLL